MATTDLPPEDPAEVLEVRLRDGSRVWIRPIKPSDRSRIEEGLKHLSPRSRFMRFHSHVERLSKTQLDYLTDVDHHDHEALVAIDPDADGQPGVGVARYIRLVDEPHIAEAAITVVDDYQGRGLGTALIGLLEPLARQRGITVFRNYVLAENEAMLSIFRDLDGTFTAEGSGLYRVDVPVPEEGEDQPDTPAGRWLAEVAKAGPPQRSAWAYPIVWLLRRLTGDAAEEEADEPPPTRSRLLKMFADIASGVDAVVEAVADAEPDVEPPAEVEPELGSAPPPEPESEPGARTESEPGDDDSVAAGGGDPAHRD